MESLDLTSSKTPIGDLNRVGHHERSTGDDFVRTVTFTVGAYFVLGSFNKFPESFCKFLCRRFIWLRHKSVVKRKKLRGRKSIIGPV